MSERTAPGVSALTLPGSKTTFLPTPVPSPSYLPQPGVVARGVGDELVLLDLNEGLFFSLNGVGPDIWSYLQQGHDVATIVDTLVKDYDVQPEAAYQDVVLFVDQLVSKKLLLLR